MRREIAGHLPGRAAPSLVIAGEFGVTVPPAVMPWIADALPASKYVEFPGVGHFVEVGSSEPFSNTGCRFLAG
jgi:pimeloyl-ACP methyl ester carboxylesterase